MALFAISTPSPSSTSPSLVHHSSPTKASSSFHAAFSSPLVSSPKNGIFVKCIPQLNSASFRQWDGLKLVGSSISQYQVKIARRSRRKNKGARASLFGVGAPEFLVIGVVALLVFGPKGLAEAARSLGKSLRSFQPTIRELQEVSREFKSTLEREIGLDDDGNPASKSSVPDKAKPKPGDSEANVEPKESIDDETKMRADKLRQALIKLQEEQEERERLEKEKAEREIAEGRISSEHETPYQDTPEVSQDSENPKEASSTPTPSPRDDGSSNAAEEAPPAVTTGPATKSDNES